MDKFQTLGNKEDTSLVANSFGYLRSPLVFNPYECQADVAITGVPFDIATSGRSGSRFGPQSIRAISTQLDWEHCRYPWDFCLKDKLKLIDCGDLVYSFGDAKSMAKALEEHTLALLKSGKTCLTLVVITSLPYRCYVLMLSIFALMVLSSLYCILMPTLIPILMAQMLTMALCSTMLQWKA